MVFSIWSLLANGWMDGWIAMNEVNQGYLNEVPTIINAPGGVLRNGAVYKVLIPTYWVSHPVSQPLRRNLEDRCLCSSPFSASSFRIECSRLA